MKRQLSLFPKNLSEELLLTQAEGKTIIVDSLCLHCKSIDTVGPHRPIHSLKWMRKNWKETSIRRFLCDTGFCSRECEQKHLQQKNNMDTLSAIKTHGEELVLRLKKGEILTKDEQKILKIYEGLYSKKNNRSGKRLDPLRSKKARIK